MASIDTANGRVRVELRWWEKFFAGGREQFILSRSDLDGVERVVHPTRYSVAPGGRAGLVVTGVVKIGRWGLGTSKSRYLSVQRRIPAVRLTLNDEAAKKIGYDELIISTPRAQQVVDALTSGG
ncbi:hypothetical protein [Gordonia soli]|uniref:Uncharacterized protein n=1 Tax=Gordonia soli NBRC 108243 TaxID=1223545 RepID=M0QIA5_9ACTN|nr:hypothetical protein [Gordonia soli]GAC68278.1 hypothetical protein GS4_14_01090 [Gordonia soli NBRC 108243]